jgi:hypothetical protein
MTIEDLVHELTQYPAETRVVVQGYEDGFDDISSVRPISVQHNLNPAWYHGEFVLVPDGGEKAVLLFGRSRSED